MNMVIAQLLLYSFSPVSWQFDELTAAERKIIGSQEALDELKKMVDSEMGSDEVAAAQAESRAAIHHH